MVHTLKTHTQYFNDIAKGMKTFEVRECDRDYKVGDFLILQDYNPATNTYSGNEIKAYVTYALLGASNLKIGIFEFLKPIIMAIKVLEVNF